MVTEAERALAWALLSFVVLAGHPQAFAAVCATALLMQRIAAWQNQVSRDSPQHHSPELPQS
jgi:hypothetical protein